MVVGVVWTVVGCSFECRGFLRVCRGCRVCSGLVLCAFCLSEGRSPSGVVLCTVGGHLQALWGPKEQYSGAADPPNRFRRVDLPRDHQVRARGLRVHGLQ